MIAFATDEIDTDRVDNEKMQWINQQVDRCKNEELELQMVSLSAENQKLHRSVDLFQRRVDTMQSEMRDLETENVKLQKTVEGNFLLADAFNDPPLSTPTTPNNPLRISVEMAEGGGGGEREEGEDRGGGDYNCL